MNYKAIFTRLGFGDMETQIYLTLLKKSPLSITDIAREIKTYRNILYQVIPLLLEK